MRYRYGEFVVTEVPRDIVDFILWFKDSRNDPKDDFVSLFIETDRAMKWCQENNIDPDDLCEGMENDDAWKLRERLEAAGFKVIGVS